MAMQEMINIDDISNEENQLRHHIYSLLAHLLRQAPDGSTLAWLA